MGWSDACGPVHHGVVIRRLQLRCSRSLVEVRLLEVNGRWVASADTESGPTLGCGLTEFEALWHALAPYSGDLVDLLASVQVDRD
jgi:hypothetical protein